MLPSDQMQNTNNKPVLESFIGDHCTFKYQELVGKCLYFNYRLIISTTSLPQLRMIDLLWTSESFVTAHHKLNNVAFSEVACCVESGLPSQRTGRTSSTKGRTRGRTLLFNHRWRRSTKLTGRSRISQRLQGNGKPFGSNCFLY